MTDKPAAHGWSECRDCGSHTYRSTCANCGSESLTPVEVKGEMSTLLNTPALRSLRDPPDPHR